MPEHAFSWKSGTLPLAEDFSFLPVLEEFREKIENTSSSRRHQLLASFGRVPGIALSILELLVILKPSQIENTYSSRKLQFLASFGRVPGTALSVPVLVVILKPPPFFTNISLSTFRLVLPCIFCTFCITALFLDSYIILRIKGGNVGHLILKG